MTENQYQIQEAPQKRSFPWGTAILGAGLAAMTGFGLHQNTQLNETKQDMLALERRIVEVQSAVGQTDSRISESLASLHQGLDATKQEALTEAQKAGVIAKRQAALVEKKLSKQQEEHATQISQKLDEVKSSTEQTNTKIGEVSSEVGNVKTEVASAKSEIEKTIGELQRQRGDLGVMSGLIATNSKELEALRQLGEKDYIEFTLTKQQKQQRVGDIVVALKKADVKRNRFTMEIAADDKKVEKKDKTVNEPVQFYVASKARAPYEMVVNEVKKDTIIGYLAVPKVKSAATAMR